MDIRNNNLNIAIVGAVSAGKSTFINTIINEKLSETSFNNTTMSPVLFIENREKGLNSSDFKNIYDKIKTTNDEVSILIKNKKVKKCEELVFEIDKLNINIHEKFGLNIYDIPGLYQLLPNNTYNTTYIDYFKNHFEKFNVIIFVIDINTSMGNKSEQNITKLIAEMTSKQLKETKKEVYILIILNKADNMQIKDDELYLDESINKLFESSKEFIYTEFEKHNVKDYIIDIIPLCAMDAFLYRMIKKYGVDYQLSESDILKIGFNQMGKKFGKMSKLEQTNEVLDFIKDETNTNEMIKLSGFDNLERCLYNFMKKDNKVQDLILSNLYIDLKSMPDFKKVFETNNNVIELKAIIDSVMPNILKLKGINDKMYIDYMNNIYYSMMKGIEVSINMSNSFSFILDFYNKIYDDIIKIYFNEIYFNDLNQKVYKDDKYPKFLKLKITTILKKYFVNNQIKIENLFNYLDKCIDLGIFISLCGEYEAILPIEEFFKDIMSNKNSKKTLIFNNKDIKNDIESLILILPVLIDQYGNDNKVLETFYRFVLLNYYQHLIDNNISGEILLRKKFLYDKEGEIVISNYLQLYLNKMNSETLLESKYFIDGLPTMENSTLNIDYCNDKLEYLYLTFMKNKRHVNIF
jgi:GTPase Era involved in 16S rRNA processing